MPEKSSNEVAANLVELYEKARVATERGNLDYAITILNQVLDKEPGFFECRQVLRAAQYKKAETAGGGFFKKAFGKATSTGPLLARGQLTLRSNPLEAIRLAESILNSDPHSAMAHKLLADAALAADFPRTAVFSLEIAYKNAPKDRELAVKLAEAAAAAGQIDRAETLYQNLLEANPADVDISMALKDLSARRTMNEGGYSALEDGSGSYRDILRNKEESVKLEQENREIKTDDVAQNLIGEYEARLVKEPKNTRLLRSLAELCAQKEEFDKAISYYEALQAANLGSDSVLEKTIADTHLKKIDQAIERLDAQAPDYADQVAKLQAQRLEYKLSECRKRAERYPSDLQIRFELGQICYEAGKIGEAIQEFQKSQSNPHRRIQSMYYLGLCFGRRGMHDLAARTFQTAISEKQLFDEEKKDLIYALGCSYEKLKKTEEAIEQFKKIYEVDIGFKDVAAKVDAYYENGAGAA
jgi:tetratricopeptide (TPR) repeat protein